MAVSTCILDLRRRLSAGTSFRTTITCPSSSRTKIRFATCSGVAQDSTISMTVLDSIDAMLSGSDAVFWTHSHRHHDGSFFVDIYYTLRSAIGIATSLPSETTPTASVHVEAYLDELDLCGTWQPADDAPIVISQEAPSAPHCPSALPLSIPRNDWTHVYADFRAPVSATLLGVYQVGTEQVVEDLVQQLTLRGGMSPDLLDEIVSSIEDTIMNGMTNSINLPPELLPYLKRLVRRVALCAGVRVIRWPT
eukprot:TRINITY_DN69998_c0_g1_i1.p1 TRINITY_DN69998_c0_g1~~TRINITY_DN69998_c0_g1_i1.p1  ORF type:complete len:278 (-),score=3.84 TRINITY_DN69998_c0_g1_i1:109-858(-)